MVGGQAGRRLVFGTPRKKCPTRGLPRIWRFCCLGGRGGGGERPCRVLLLHSYRVQSPTSRVDGTPAPPPRRFVDIVEGGPSRRKSFEQRAGA